MRDKGGRLSDSFIDATLRGADVLLRIVARSVIAVEAEVTGPQLRVLVLILRGGPTSPGAVATELAVHASNATRICGRLEAKKYIERAPSGTDRRFAIFDLTARGRTLVTGVMAQRRDAVTRLANRLTEADRTALGRALDILARSDEESDSVSAFTLTAVPVDPVTAVLPQQKQRRSQH
jgi:DNA-binding MarR family transcriptional regulator